MRPVIEIYKSQIEDVEFTQKYGDAYWGYYSAEEAKDKYVSLSLDIRGDESITSEAKKILLDLIEEKIKKIPEVEKIKEKHIEERDKAIMRAEERYNKLNVLKRAKLFLSHQNPKNIAFHELDLKHINELYDKKSKKK